MDNVSPLGQKDLKLAVIQLSPPLSVICQYASCIKSTSSIFVWRRIFLCAVAASKLILKWNLQRVRLQTSSHLRKDWVWLKVKCNRNFTSSSLPSHIPHVGLCFPPNLVSCFIRNWAFFISLRPI